MQHENGATGLNTVILCVENPLETAQRYARFTGLAVAGGDDVLHVDTSRGRVLFCPRATIMRVFNIEPSTLPWIAGYALATRNIEAARRQAADSGYAYGALDDGRIYVVPPAGIGGIIVFETEDSAPLDF